MSLHFGRPWLADGLPLVPFPSLALQCLIPGEGVHTVSYFFDRSVLKESTEVLHSQTKIASRVLGAGLLLNTRPNKSRTYFFLSMAWDSVHMMKLYRGIGSAGCW